MQTDNTLQIWYMYNDFDHNWQKTSHSSNMLNMTLYRLTEEGWSSKATQNKMECIFNEISIKL